MASSVVSFQEVHQKGAVAWGLGHAVVGQNRRAVFRRRAEDRMRELRGLTRLQEIARRIVMAFDEAYDGAKQDVRSDVVLAHRVARLDLLVRMVSDEEAAAAKAKVESLSKDPANQTLVGWHQGIVDRHANQKSHPTHETEIHVLRLGDVAIATHPFELFLDFGIQIKARSPALQTFVVQLVGVQGYLPTARAVRGGGYSAVAESNSRQRLNRLFVLNGIPECLIERSRPMGTHGALAHLATAEIDLGRKGDPRDGLVGDHQTSVREFDANPRGDISEQGEQFSLLFDRPDGGISGAGIHRGHSRQQVSAI